MHQLDALETSVSLSVVIIGRNEAANLRRCLQSITIARSRLPNPPSFWEVIFVDAGSNDYSCDIAEEYTDKVFVVEGPNTWAPTARAIGLQESRGELVLFLDADMELDVDWLVSALPALNATADAWGVAGIRDDIYVHETSGDIVGRRENVYGVREKGRATNVGGGVMIRRELVKRLGGYRSELRKWADPDLHARILSVGGYILQLPVPFVRHYTPPPNEDKRKFSRIFAPRGDAFYFGLMFFRACDNNYLIGLAKVFLATSVVWVADVVSFILLMKRRFKAVAIVQVGCILIVRRMGRPQDYILGRAWAAGVLMYGWNALRRNAEPDGMQHHGVMHLQYRRFVSCEVNENLPED